MINDATKIRFPMGALLALVATLPTCSREVFCAPCPACTAVVVAPAATPAPGTGESVAAAPIKKEEAPDAGPAAMAVAAARKAPAAPVHHASKAEPALSGGRVRNAKEYFTTLKNRFVPGAAKGVHAVFQFDLTGPDAVSYHVAVDDGAMKLEEGQAEKANVTICASTDAYVEVVNGELGGTGAVLSRRMKVGGDLILARRMAKIFPGGHPDK